MVCREIMIVMVVSMIILSGCSSFENDVNKLQELAKYDCGVRKMEYVGMKADNGYIAVCKTNSPDKIYNFRMGEYGDN